MTNFGSNKKKDGCVKPHLFPIYFILKLYFN